MVVGIVAMASLGGSIISLVMLSLGQGMLRSFLYGYVGSGIAITLAGAAIIALCRIRHETDQQPVQRRTTPIVRHNVSMSSRNDCA